MFKNAQEYIEAYKRGEVDNLNDFPLYIDAFVYKVCYKYLNIASIEELYQMAWVSILESIDKYDPAKGLGVLSFVEYSIKMGFLKYIRGNNTNSRKANSDCVYLDKEVNLEASEDTYKSIVSYNYDSAEDIAIYNSIKKEYFKYTSQQKEKIRTILNLSFYEYSQTDISKIIGTSRSYVQKVLRDHRSKIKDIVLEKESLKSRAF